MEEQMGTTLPFHPDEDDADERAIPPEMEIKISQLAAQASQVLLQRDKTEMAAKAAQQAAQDPIVQMQMQELQIKKQEADIKAKKLVADASAKADQLQIELARIQSQERIAGLQTGSKVQKDKMDANVKMRLEGAKIGADVAKTREQLKSQALQAMQQKIQQSNKPQKGEE
jgi:hypothetical protein